MKKFLCGVTVMLGFMLIPSVTMAITIPFGQTGQAKAAPKAPDTPTAPAAPTAPTAPTSPGSVAASPASTNNSDTANWYWLSSDDKYSKYYDTKSVKVTKQANTARGAVPTEITAWTKTTYSYGGAKETIDNYEIKNLVPDPASLSYSLAEVQINPQNRTIQYLKENFYNPSGNVIWSKTSGRVKEINSQEFDEDFYDAIVDFVFRLGETDRSKAKDRWIDLWEIKAPDGSLTRLTADTTTMRRKGENLIMWQWQETKNAQGKIQEVKFMKKNVNLPQGTEKIISGKYWSPQKGWQILDDATDGTSRLIVENSPEFKGLARLRAYADGYSMWVNRYSIE